MRKYGVVTTKQQKKSQKTSKSKKKLNSDKREKQMAWSTGAVAEVNTELENKKFPPPPEGYGVGVIVTSLETKTTKGSLQLEIEVGNISITNPIREGEVPRDLGNLKVKNWIQVGNEQSAVYVRRFYESTGMTKEEINSDIELTAEFFLNKPIHFYFQPGDRDSGVFHQIFIMPIAEFKDNMESGKMPNGCYPLRTANSPKIGSNNTSKGVDFSALRNNNNKATGNGSGVSVKPPAAGLNVPPRRPPAKSAEELLKEVENTPDSE